MAQIKASFCLLRTVRRVSEEKPLSWLENPNKISNWESKTQNNLQPKPKRVFFTTLQNSKNRNVENKDKLL